MQEVNLETAKVQEVSETVVQSTEVEYALANAHEISRATVMEDVQNMASVGNGADTNIALKLAIMESSNEEQKSVEQTMFNTQDNSVLTYASCETQTIVTNHSTNATQTELPFLQPSSTQTDRIIEDCSSTQTDVTNFEEKECQTNGPDVNSQEVQTEMKVVEV